ncbi:MAG TPA: hypothetical protein VJN43_05495 [Bryobacteraceae bacterium]|nr:hypothetical protein [Bryobacteraceae bacterium]
MKFAFALLLIALPLAAAEQPAGSPAEDLARIQTETNLEKRARAALDNADDALKRARDAYQKGDSTEANARLSEIEQSVVLADESLKATHKNPSRSPKHFKQAEMRTRELLRKLDGFRDEMSVTDRPALDRVASAVQKIHDALLDGIMGGKKK